MSRLFALKFMLSTRLVGVVIILYFVKWSSGESGDGSGPMCLDCGGVIPAYCLINDTAKTMSCGANTTSCSQQQCMEDTYCHLVFTLSLSGDWMFLPNCFGEPREKKKCVFQLAHPFDDTFPPEHGILCQCNVIENCSLKEPLTYFHKIKNDDNTTTSSDVMITSLILPSSTPSSMTTVSDTTDSNPIITLLIPIISLVIIILIISGALIGIISYKKYRNKSNTRPVQCHTLPHSEANGTGFQNLTNEQDLPFQLGHLVSRGRYGYVYRTEYENELVAVKIFVYQNRQSWENERSLFAMQSTKHRNVIDYIISGSWGSGYEHQMFIVTPFYPLGSLNRFLARNTVSWEQACRVIHSVTSGVAHLHSESYTNTDGIIVDKYAIAHRDIKSANVLVRGENGDCVISDLGFALILDPARDDKDLANAGQVGTFRYMAPEVLDARVNLQSPQAFTQIDIYALALVMWEVIWRCNVQEEETPRDYMMAYEDSVGKRPGIDTIKDAVCTQKLRPQILPAWRNHPGLGSLVDTIEDCWDKDPEARLSASNVILRMKELLDGGPASLTTDHTPSHSFDRVPVVVGNDRYRRRSEAQESTADTICTTDSRPPPYDSRWSYANVGGGDERVNHDENSMGLNYNETTI